MSDTVSTLILFGATGDLAARMLLPSLYGLDCDGLLPPHLRIIGTARTDQNDAEFRAHALAAIRDHVSACLFDEARVATFLEQIHYVPLDATDTLGFHRLAKVAGDTSGGVAIFLSTAPSLFKATIDGVRAAWLAAGMTPRPYASGNWGPSAAIALAERNGVSWND